MLEKLYINVLLPVLEVWKVLVYFCLLGSATFFRVQVLIEANPSQWSGNAPDNIDKINKKLHYPAARLDIT